MTIDLRRLVNHHSLKLTGIAAILSAALALFISFSYFKIFPIQLNPTVLTEPVLFREGYLPFNNIADQKPPLLQYFIAWILPIFKGNNVLALRCLHSLLIFWTVTISLLWLYRLKGGWALFAGGVFFLAWSFPFGYWNAMYFDFALAPFYALALFFLTKPENRHSPWSSVLFGLITGLAILIKQQAVILCVLTALSFAWLGLSHKVSLIVLSRMAVGYALGLVLPIVVFILFFIRAGGNIGELIYWTITINLNGSYARMAKLLPDRQTILGYLPSLILLPFYLWSLFSKSEEKYPTHKFRLWLLAIFFSAMILVYPRWSGRHLAATLPFLAILSGIASAELVHIPVKKVRDLAGLALYIGILIWWGSTAVNMYRSYNYQSRLDRFDAYSSFIGLSNKINRSIPLEGSIVFVPTDDGTMNLYYILNRLPPSFIFFNNPWFMEERVIQHWLDAMDQDRPAAVIYFKGRLEVEKYAPLMIEYLNQHYKVEKQLTWEDHPVLIMTRLP